jgi:hypothetical protein
MHSALVQFRKNLEGVRELGTLAAVANLTQPVVDVSDILRSEIVFAVSALDHFVHEMTRLGMVDSANGKRIKTEAYLRFQVPLTAAEAALGGMPSESWLSEAIREKHSWLSFQEPDKIADAVRLVSSVKLWEAVGVELSMTAAAVKTQLKVIVDRRNKIAHEADMDPVNPGERWPITPALVNDAIGFMERVAAAIDKVAV